MEGLLLLVYGFGKRLQRVGEKEQCRVASEVDGEGLGGEVGGSFTFEDFGAAYEGTEDPLVCRYCYDPGKEREKQTQDSETEHL